MKLGPSPSPVPATVPATFLERWWIQAATEGLSLILAGVGGEGGERGDSHGLAESVSNVMDGTIVYGLRPGLQVPRLEAQLERLLATAKDPVDVVGLAVILAMVLNKIGEESRAKTLLDRDRVLEAYGVLMSLDWSDCPHIRTECMFFRQAKWRRYMEFERRHHGLE